MNKAEEFIQNYTRNCSNEIIGGGWVNGEFVQIFNSWLTPNDARRAVEIAREEIYEWLRVNLCDYFDAPREDYDMCINDLKQAMEDKV